MKALELIGPASRTDELHEAIQRFHDLIVANASIKAALHFADGLAQTAQPLTDDPCPGCQVGTVCRTPKCGRLKLPVDHPLRTGVKP